MKLKTRILLIALPISILSIIVLEALSFHFIRNEISERAGLDVEKTVHDLQHELSTYIDSAFNTMEQYGDFPIFEQYFRFNEYGLNEEANIAEEEVAVTLNKLIVRNDRYIGIGYYDILGRAVARTDSHDLWSHMDGASCSAFGGRKDVTICDSPDSKNFDLPILKLQYGLYADNGEAMGMLTAFLSLESIFQHLAHKLSTPSSILYIRNSGGLLYASGDVASVENSSEYVSLKPKKLGDIGWSVGLYLPKGELFGVIQRLKTLAVIVIVIAVIGSIFILNFISGWISKPATQVVDVIDRISKGDLNIGDELVRSRVSEFKRILKALRGMAQKIKVLQDELQRKASIAAMGTISSHIAHDMRSPLSVLKTYADLKTSVNDDPDVEDLRQSAQRSVGKLERMAVDLVDYAKASKLERVHHALSGIIYEGSIAEAKKRVEDKGVKIVSAIQGGILVNVDAHKLERVMTNLVNNAVQSIDNGAGEVSIAATAEHNGVLKITVRDNGKGIDRDVLPHVFDSFFTKGKRGGSGLGLAYCKQVIEAHGGTIDVVSELGKGTEFTIKIPNCAVEYAEARHSRPCLLPAGAGSSGNPGLDLGSGAGMTGGARDSRHGGQASTTVGMTGKSILIADDDPEIRRQWEQIIPEHGGTIVHSAKTVKEVEEAAIDYSKIDTAIVDYQFYGEDKTGIDLIKHLKAKGVKTVYLCTGFYDNEVIIKQAQAVGVERILPKPIDTSLLG